MNNTTNLDDAILIYDVSGIPYSTTLEQITQLFKEQKVVLYDSYRLRDKAVPQILCLNPEVVFKAIDTRDLKPNECKELLANIKAGYEIERKAKEADEEFPDFCNMDGRAVSKYVYYVRKILFVTTSMSGEWMEDYKKAKESIIFPELTEEQVVQLRIEELNKTIKK